MHAIRLLRSMHADAKTRFKLILGATPPASAAGAWDALLPVLDLHEQLEDQFVYGPLRDEVEPDSLLGTWTIEHDQDVVLIKQQLERVDGLQAGTPAWQMAVASAFELLSKHVLVEENEIFGRIEQLWGPKRLAETGAKMEPIVRKASSGAARRQPRAEAVARA